MPTPTLLCARCGANLVPRLSWQTPALRRADCAGCGKYIKYVPHTPEWIAEPAPDPLACLDPLPATAPRTRDLFS